jgi:hypothetical protein
LASNTTLQTLSLRYNQVGDAKAALKAAAPNVNIHC